MNKVLKESFKGRIKNVFMPQVYKDGFYLDEDNINIIGFEVETDNGLLRIVEEENDHNISLFKDDVISINKYVISGNYEEYKSEMLKLLKLYYSNLNEEEFRRKTKELIMSYEDYLNNPKNIIEYEINFT